MEQLHQPSTTTPERNQLHEDSRILVNDDVQKLTGGDNHNAPLPAIPNTAADDTSNDVSEIGTSSNSEQLPGTIDTKSSTFDYLYEFSETRKVLEEFFKCPSNDRPSILENGSDVDSIVSICFCSIALGGFLVVVFWLMLYHIFGVKGELVFSVFFVN